jgi:lipid-A-disaccharide synthase
MKYYIIAGEASGDLHGSNLMKGLYSEDPSADIRFWGGSLMDGVYHSHQRGQGLVRDYNEGAVMGFSQVLLNLGKFAKRLKGCMEDIDSFHPDVVILIDYPGFNFRVAQAAHEKGYKVFYYIAPKVWASRESRVKKIKKYVDRLFIVFPFEKEYFKKKGIDYIYKGNPLVDAIDSSPLVNMSREEFFKANSLPECKYIAILAGSRKGEVGTMMPVCAEFIKKMSSTPGYEDYRFIIAGAPSRTMDDYAPYLEGISDRAKVIFSQTYAILKNAEAAVINSGTASLEACLIGTPQVVGFVLSPFNFTLGRQIIKVDMISLGNLILGRKAFKELLQHYFSAENLLSEVRRLVEDNAYRETMKEDYATIRKELGGSGASAAVAEAMVGELRKG